VSPRRPLPRARNAYVALLALALPLAAYGALQRTGDAIVQFVALGPGGLRIVGKSAELTVADRGATLVVSSPLAALRTGIALRDRHLREKYLQVAQYPTITLEVARSALKWPAPGATVSDEANGTLRLHGRTKAIRFKYTAHNDAGRIKVSGGFRIDIRDFGMEVPSYLGLKVKPQVDAGAEFSVVDRR
jgi:polyisoprenoid-binding protein YceI